MPYRINGQYIMEGACGGLFYTLGGETHKAFASAQRLKTRSFGALRPPTNPSNILLSAQMFDSQTSCTSHSQAQE